MSLDKKFIRNTDFVAGFSFKGKRRTDTGEDLLTATGIDVETMDGTPVVFNGDMETVAVVADGGTPDAILYSRISNELTMAEQMLTSITRDEVRIGDPFTIVLAKKNGVIRTNLIADAGTVAVDDDVFVAAGEYTTTNPGTDDVIGRIIETDGTNVTILLK